MRRLIPIIIVSLLVVSAQAQVPGMDPADELAVAYVAPVAEDATIAPNPVRSLHSVHCNLPGEAVEGELLVYNMNGLQVRRIPVHGENAEVGLRGLRPGTYSYRLKTKAGNTSARKLSVVR